MLVNETSIHFSPLRTNGLNVSNYRTIGYKKEYRCRILSLCWRPIGGFWLVCSLWSLLIWFMTNQWTNIQDDRQQPRTTIEYQTSGLMVSHVLASYFFFYILTFGWIYVQCCNIIGDSNPDINERKEIKRSADSL